MNRTPFQGFNTVIPAPLVIPAKAGISYLIASQGGAFPKSCQADLLIARDSAP
ncbi:MAG: hypothetical protein ACR2P4_04285 [Gammaproteobacteria bacterium]